MGAEGKFLARAGAHVQIEKDGSVIVAVGNTEMGQGARTVLAQVASEALGIPYEKVDVIPSDTTRIPDSGPTVASRTTVMSGNAILNACHPLRQRIDKVVRMVLKGRPLDKVNAGNGYYRLAGKKRKVSYQEVIEKCYALREHMASQGWYKVQGTSFDRKSGRGDAYFTYTFSTMACEVEVDMETGQVQVLRFISSHDIGKAVNPQLAEGQIQGGALQGIGYALMENLVLKDGIILNPNFTGYTIPTAKDTPELVSIIVEKPYPEGPYGAKGLGEPPLICAAPAVTNAIFNATGIRVRKIPAIPEEILELKG